MSYEKLGLKCGLEIHQQLEGKKLFCNCPTMMRDDTPDFKIQRQLRASAGESGVVDVAAAQEQLKARQFVYQGYNDTTCLVEVDAEPPHAVNFDALYTALQFSLLLKAHIYPIVQMMRKTIVDGSATSGFQRTGMIARQGMLQMEDKVITIEGISLEEDACKIISDSSHEKVYQLDRLGIALIEVSTGPDITSAQECQDVAKKLGLLLRSLPGVKRGLGTIRQDVNVSIARGNRVEIKGAQDLRMLPTLVDLEVKRQEELLKIRDEMKDVKLEKIEIVDVSDILKLANSKIFSSALEKKGRILGMKLNGFAGYLGRELQPGYRLGTELSGRAKIYAGVGGIIHSDEFDPNTPQKYGLTVEIIKNVEEKLNVKNKDAYVIVADMEEKGRRALQVAYERAQEVFVGVPKEVRKANADGTTSFLRPMPGAARMYPETDVPLIRPDLKGIKLPELIEEKVVRYQKVMGLAKDLAEFVAKSDKVLLFEEMVGKYSTLKPAFIAETLTSTLLGIKRDYDADPEKLTDDDFRVFFAYLNEGKIHKDIALNVLIDMIKGQFDVGRYEKLSTETLHQGMIEIISANKGAPLSALMGLCMKKFAGKADGKMISEELKKLIEKGHKD